MVQKFMTFICTSATNAQEISLCVQNAIYRSRAMQKLKAVWCREEKKKPKTKS